MDVLIIMCLGIITGRFLCSSHAKKISETISILCTFLLIFSMGVMLGGNENFFKDLSSLGWSSLLFFLIPTAFSILIVFILTRKMMVKNNTKKEKRNSHDCLVYDFRIGFRITLWPVRHRNNARRTHKQKY